MEYEVILAAVKENCFHFKDKIIEEIAFKIFNSDSIVYFYSSEFKYHRVYDNNPINIHIDKHTHKMLNELSYIMEVNGKLTFTYDHWMKILNYIKLFENI